MVRLKPLEKWAKDLVKEVYNEWKTKYSFWESGFKVFYSPIRNNPKLLILSLNPGGDKESFEENKKSFENNDFTLPKRIRYAEAKYPMAKQIQKFFGKNSELLEESVSFPILFFRSRNWNYWKKNTEKKIRSEMEQFSYQKVQEIIEKIKPKNVLIVGFKTYDKIKESHILDIDSKEFVKKDKHRLFIKTKAEKINIFCIPHLSGYHISNEKMNIIQKEFFNYIRF